MKFIKKDGVHVSGPDHGDQACGDFGMGRLINYESLMLDIKRSTSGLLFKGKKILISTGATVEKIDSANNNNITQLDIPYTLSLLIHITIHLFYRLIT